MKRKKMWDGGGSKDKEKEEQWWNGFISSELFEFSIHCIKVCKEPVCHLFFQTRFHYILNDTTPLGKKIYKMYIASKLGDPGGLSLSMWLSVLISSNAVHAGITQTNSTVIFHCLASTNDPEGDPHVAAYYLSEHYSIYIFSL